MGQRRGVPVRQRRVSAEMRAWRKKAGFTCADVAKALGTSITKISRMETGERGLYPDDVSAFLGFCQVPTSEREELLALVRSGGDPSWWQTNREGLPGWKDLINLESEATAIANFESMVMPGLVQTAEYASALFRGLDATLPEAKINWMVASRMSRQAMLTKLNAPTLHLIVDEMVLRRPIGAPGVLRRQLEHLVICADQPNIKVQVVPVLAGATPAMKGPVMIIDLDEYCSVAHFEAHDGGGFFSEEPVVRRAKLTWERLSAVALSTDRSVGLIAALAGEMPRRP